MLQTISSPAVVGLTALIIVVATTIPTFIHIFHKIRSQQKENGFEELHKLYEDRDGIATEESQKEYSAAIPKYIGLSSSFLGFLASIAAAVIDSIRPAENLFIENWISLGSWVRHLPLSCSFAR